jgi:hypothetical protein
MQDQASLRSWICDVTWRKHAHLHAANGAESESFQDESAITAGIHAFEGMGTWRGSDRRQAYRALKGRTLRQEVYAEDGTSAATTPYVVTERTYRVSSPASVRRRRPRRVPGLAAGHRHPPLTEALRSAGVITHEDLASAIEGPK